MPEEGSYSDISPDDYRSGMRQLAASVNVITVSHNGERDGLTATAVCSVSVKPPQLLVCVNRIAGAHDLIQSEGVFGINVLARDQEDVAKRFAGIDGVEREDRYSLGAWKYIALPALALCPRVLGRNAQITRATMIEELGKQYVATARSKGLAEGVILKSHVLKNASISIVTLMGDELAGFMNGATIVETIFGWPGLGALLIDAINARDLPVITATVFIVALMVMAINLAVDMVYTYLDPRIQYS